MSDRIRRGRAQYNTGPDTRPNGTGGMRQPDPKRPGGAYGGGPATGSHDFNNKPAQKRWPRGRG